MMEPQVEHWKRMAEHFKAEWDKAIAEIDYLRRMVELWKSRDGFIFDSVGECHMMISNNWTTHSSEFGETTLPARVGKLIAENIQLREQIKKLGVSHD